MHQPMTSFNFRKLFISHVIVLLLALSFIAPLTTFLWDMIDIFCFRMLNEPLRSSVAWQVVWGLANHKWADWVHDLVFLILIIAAVRSFPKEERPRKIAEFIFLLLYIAAIIFFVNRVLFREHLQLERISPTLALANPVKMSQVISWLKLKHTSTRSFPGDHATTAILFALGYAYYAPRKLAIFGFLYGGLICLPRLVAGAHWASDILVGSLSIALICLSWAFYSPLGCKIICYIEKILKRFVRAYEYLI